MYSVGAGEMRPFNNIKEAQQYVQEHPKADASENALNWLVTAGIAAPAATTVGLAGYFGDRLFHDIVKSYNGEDIDKNGMWIYNPGGWLTSYGISKIPQVSRAMYSFGRTNFGTKGSRLSYVMDQNLGYLEVPQALDIRYSLPTYYKSAGNVFNKDKYLLNGQWNIPIIQQEMKSGLNKAQDYFSSQLRKDINTRNLIEAKQMGLQHFDINRNSANRVQQPLTSKAIADPNVSWYARINSPGANPLDDILEINLVSPDIENSVFHETLHRGSLGIAEPQRTGETFTAFRNRVKDTNKFYQKKVESFLKPRNEIPDELKNGYDYISESMETGANYFEAGQRLGIKAGSPYPGDDKVLEIIKNSETDPRMLGKEKLLSFARTDSEGLRNLWKALTGTLFIFPLIYGTFNSNSQNQ